MQVIALTGGIGSGKSTASSIFADLSVPIVDLDAISHQLTSANQPLVKKIAAAFGSAYVTNDNALNRPVMRELVFNDASAREKLNAILHPAIYNEAVEMLKSFGDEPYVILEIPLLFKESKYHQIIDQVLVIDCSEDTQIERVKRRSDLSEKAIKQIIKTQPSRKERLDIADDVLTNDEDVAELREKISKLHQKYINTCIVSKTIS